MPARQLLHPYAFCSLASAKLDGDVIETYKSDQRSEVWQTMRDGQAVAVKRFVYSPRRQWFSLHIGAHAGQVEMRWNKRLQKAGIPVVPIVDCGIDRQGCCGCHGWLATPIRGESMFHLINDEVIRRERGEALLDLSIDLALKLLRANFWSRDFKPSNIVIDQDKAWLIDVGSARRNPTDAKLVRMLAVMKKRLGTGGAEDHFYQRFEKEVLAEWSAIKGKR
jgi:tRNA A-37 threonylcarbamoyl transferase component Bud32